MNFGLIKFLISIILTIVVVLLAFNHLDKLYLRESTLAFEKHAERMAEMEAAEEDEEEDEEAGEEGEGFDDDDSSADEGEEFDE